MMVKHPLLLLELLSGAIQSVLMEMATHSMETARRIRSVVGEYGALGMRFGIALVDEVAQASSIHGVDE